jgi:coiled-coil domain-containing protein 130
MAERRAQNKYIPNDFDPKKYKSINDYVKHQRNPKSGKGINKRQYQPDPDDAFGGLKDKPVTPSTTFKTQSVRFELPFNCWCLNCENHIGMGVRYNAEKVHIGFYYTTPIFSFKMKCHLCPGRIVIETDPKNGEYLLKEGLRKRIETFDPKDAGLPEFADEGEKQKLEADVFYKLEHGLLDANKAEKAALGIDELQKFNDTYWKDPYTLSQAVRKKFRVEKKEAKALLVESQSLQDKIGLSIPILPQDEKDQATAKGILFQTTSKANSMSQANAREKLLKLVKASKSRGKGF